MESVKSFNQLFGKFPAVSFLNLWPDVDDFKLICWQSKHLYVCNLTNHQILNVLVSPKLFSCYEEIVSEEDIIEVFYIKNTFFAVDSDCYISELVRETVHDTEWEGDLFEDTPKKLLKSQLKKKFHVSKDSTLLTACWFPYGIAFLLNTPDSILVKIVDPITLKELRSFTVRNSPLAVRAHHNKCLMLFVSKDEIESAFIKNWFPECIDENSKSDLLIVSLPECIVCGVLLDQKPLVPRFIFSWPFQAVFAHWICLENNEPGRVKKQSTLILVFDGGTVAILGQYGGKLAYMPLNRIKNAIVTSDQIIATDYSDCYAIDISNLEEIYSVPLKGVLGFCKIPGQNNIILASTKHRTLYALNLNIKPIRPAIFKMPNLGIFDEFLMKNNYFEQLCKKVDEQDQFINALSYSLNPSILKFSLSVKVVLIAGNSHSFRIVINSNNPGIIFHGKIWKLIVSIYSKDVCYTFVRKLDIDLTADCPLVDFITVDFFGDHWDITVDTNLVCYIGNHCKYRPGINIGNVLLDISHFIQPISSLKIHKSTVEKFIDIREILEGISLKYPTEEVSVTQINLDTDRTCIIEIPVSETLSNEVIVQRLLSNCRALWRADEWNRICQIDKFDIIIAGKIIKIEIHKGLLKIYGKHLEICNSLKIASIKFFNDNYQLNINDGMKKQLHDMLTTLECIQYSYEENTSEILQNTLSIYKDLKENVIQPLTGIKVIFKSNAATLIES